MTQAEKLEALVRRGIKRGLQAETVKIENGYIVLKTWKGHKDNCRNDAYRSLEILFDQKLGLARALFGEYGPCSFYVPAHEPYDEPDSIEYFQYRLQQAVISDDPIDYMYKVVFGDEQL